jgi:transposase
MEKFINAIGIDVSKDTIDTHDYLLNTGKQFTNDQMGFKKMKKWIHAANNQVDGFIICFEHTGIYSLPLAIFLTDEKIAFSMVAGLEIKRSLGIQRGKNDQLDAKRIAHYAFLRRGELKLTHLASKSLLQLKSLLSLREKMVKQRAGFKSAVNEMKQFFTVNENKVWFATQKKLINTLDDQIEKVESAMKQLINQDAHLKKLFSLVTSVKGVGLVLGISFIVYTNGFTSFENWRKFATYSGIAPFEYRSGVSIKGKTKVSPLANRRLKGLLSNAACCAIQHCSEMKQYYNRRIDSGKSKMSTQNIIRNKIVARVFAAVKRQTPYVDILKYAA